MKTSISAALAALFMCAAQSASAEYAYSYQNIVPATETIHLAGQVFTQPTTVTASFSILFSNALGANQTYGLADALAYNHEYVTDSTYDRFRSKDAQDQGGFVTSFYLHTNSLGQIDDWSVQYNVCGCQETLITTTSLDSVYLGIKIGEVVGSTTQTSTWIETYLATPFANGIPPEGYTPPPFVSEVPEPSSYALLLAGLGVLSAAYRRKA